MPLRVGFDMDGVLADFGTAYRDVERALFGDSVDAPPTAPENDPASEAERDPASARQPKDDDRRRRAVWNRIRSIPDFWTTLNATEPGAVRQLRAAMTRHQWEVVFITQRPATAGDTVQRQTQRWLVQQGFDLPSVLVIAGSRGAAIHALKLTHHVDDSPQNCLDVKSDSSARPILIVKRSDDHTARQACKLGMDNAASFGDALEILERASRGSSQPGMLSRLSALVNWTADQRAVR